jgi:hypothetical protein
MTTEASYVPVVGSKLNLVYRIVYKDHSFALVAYNPANLNEKMIFALPDEVFKLMLKCYRTERRKSAKSKCPTSNESKKP